jgi:hypothetical protein
MEYGLAGIAVWRSLRKTTDSGRRRGEDSLRNE